MPELTPQGRRWLIEAIDARRRAQLSKPGVALGQGGKKVEPRRMPARPEHVFKPSNGRIPLDGSHSPSNATHPSDDS